MVSCRYCLKGLININVYEFVSPLYFPVLGNDHELEILGIEAKYK